MAGSPQGEPAILVPATKVAARQQAADAASRFGFPGRRPAFPTLEAGRTVNHGDIEIRRHFGEVGSPVSVVSASAVIESMSAARQDHPQLLPARRTAGPHVHRNLPLRTGCPLPNHDEVGH